jgi:hypothetical protein
MNKGLSRIPVSGSVRPTAEEVDSESAQGHASPDPQPPRRIRPANARCRIIPTEPAVPVVPMWSEAMLAQRRDRALNWRSPDLDHDDMIEGAGQGALAIFDSPYPPFRAGPMAPTATKQSADVAGRLDFPSMAGTRIPRPSSGASFSPKQRRYGNQLASRPRRDTNIHDAQSVSPLSGAPIRSPSRTKSPVHIEIDL